MHDWLNVMSQNWCATKRLPLYRSRQSIRRSKPGVLQAIRRTYSYRTLGVLAFKFIKSKEKLEGCARKWTKYHFFLYWLQTFGRLIMLASRAEKNPGQLCVVKFYSPVNTIKVMSNQSVNLLGSIFFNTRFQDRSMYQSIIFTMHWNSYFITLLSLRIKCKCLFKNDKNTKFIINVSIAIFSIRFYRMWLLQIVTKLKTDIKH